MKHPFHHTNNHGSCFKCPVSADNSLGPAIIRGCQDGFDFTLLFEQSFLSMAPSLSLFVLSIYRCFQLSRRLAVVNRRIDALVLGKIVSLPLLLHQQGIV